MDKRKILSCLLLLTTISLAGCQDNSPAVVVSVVSPAPPLELLEANSRDDDFQFILDSYARTGDLHTVTLCGDFQQLIDVQHWGIMMEMDRREPRNPPNRHGCSMFQCRTNSGSTLLGRNFDHKSGDLLAAWCYPDSGYTSLSFIPMNQWGFNDENLFDPDNPQHKRHLINGSVTTIEGMNEKGVTITLASLDKQETEADPFREPRFLIHLVREILDHAANLDEAVAIASKYNIFDNGHHIITHHIFLADPVSGSAVIEWQDGRMKVLASGPDPQVITNTPMCGVDDDHLRRSCRRYRSIAQALDQADTDFDWQAGMNALAGAAQHNATFIIEGERWRVSTQWSAVFDMTALQAYVCLDRDFGTVYKLKVPDRPTP